LDRGQRSRLEPGERVGHPVRDEGADVRQAFAVNDDPEAQNRFVDSLCIIIITSAVSLGHDESLIVHAGVEHYPEPFRKYGHLRLSVGLEDADDLIADIRAALDATFPS
jgi:canavanine-gamma-lyase